MFTLRLPDQRKTSYQVLKYYRLRAEAEAAVENLEKEVSIAEMQGYQTLYHRIPLITADIGLGIRSKLVWFQSEEEETKILEYIIASCSEASHEIEVLLSAQKSKVPVLAPENETTASGILRSSLSSIE